MAILVQNFDILVGPVSLHFLIDKAIGRGNYFFSHLHCIAVITFIRHLFDLIASFKIDDVLYVL